MVLHHTASSGTSLASLSTISVASEGDLDYATLFTHHISENTSPDAERTDGEGTVDEAICKQTVAETTVPETTIAETTVAETTTFAETTGAEISDPGSADNEHNGYCLPLIDGRGNKQKQSINHAIN